MTSPVAGTAGVQDPCAEAGRGGGAAREISVPAGPFRWETKAAPEKISLLKKKKSLCGLVGAIPAVGSGPCAPGPNVPSSALPASTAGLPWASNLVYLQGRRGSCSPYVQQSGP